MKITKLKGYQAPQLFFESEQLTESLLCASSVASDGIGDYTEDDFTNYFNLN